MNRPTPDLDEIRDSLRKLEATARGPQRGPRVPAPSLRKRARRAQKAARKVNR